MKSILVFVLQLLLLVHPHLGGKHYLVEVEDSPTSGKGKVSDQGNDYQGDDSVSETVDVTAVSNNGDGYVSETVNRTDNGNGYVSETVNVTDNHNAYICLF